MPRTSPAPLELTASDARRIWLRAQRLDKPAPFGSGAAATQAAVEHLGYVQIDTINVIERSHHHILWTRIPEYRRADLHQALSIDKSVFEYWTHALSYVPTRDYRFFMGDMKREREAPRRWIAGTTPAGLRGIIARIRREGPLSIRDIDDDKLVEKEHPWASRKPSKQALQRAFYRGELTISAREGMVKTYELTDRHFGWPPRPRRASDREVLDYLLDRSLRAQGLVSLESIPQLDRARKRAMADLIAARVKRGRLIPVSVPESGRTPYWLAPEAADVPPAPAPDTVHVLSPFDPLVIQRRRLAALFGYEHRFEAYVPKARRVLGYFALPVLVGDRIVAAIDTKTDRERGELLIRQWTWIGDSEHHKPLIEEALHRFERFQFDS